MISQAVKYCVLNGVERNKEVNLAAKVEKEDVNGQYGCIQYPLHGIIDNICSPICFFILSHHIRAPHFTYLRSVCRIQITNVLMARIMDNDVGVDPLREQDKLHL
jgi:hypothetical protein